MATFHENLKQSFKNFKNKYIGNVPSGVTLAQINADLTDIITASKVGVGTKNFTIDSNRKRLLCITKKSGVIVETKEIPISVLASGDVIPLGNTAPVIGVEPKNNLTGTTATNLVKKEIAIWTSKTGSTYHTTVYDTNDITNLGNDSNIALSADLSNAIGAKITYNGNNSFTINVTDSSLSVYVY